MVWERLTEQLQRAHERWQSNDTPAGGKRDATATRLSRREAEEFVSRARDLLVAPPVQPAGNRDSSLIVTKAPHTGSSFTVTAILARCLAFGVTVERVVQKPPEDADRIAHALYPDVWLNFARLPSGTSVWSRIDKTFDNDHYGTIFGEPYRRAAVVTGLQACQDNGLTQAELMAIWQIGRESLSLADALDTYGRAGTELMSAASGGNAYAWYRGPLPVGIHKINSSLMAFALRDEHLYGGRPVIVLNGHYTLLSQRFRGHGGRGPTVIEIGLDERPTIYDIRHLLIGAADQPAECLPGTIRRDACDGFFDTDAPGEPVVPWANAVHASDGYLAGAIEKAAMLGGTQTDGMTRRLRDIGYTATEIDTLIMKDPIVVAHGDEKRLTKRTAMQDREDCTTTIRGFFPPLSADGAPPASAYLLSALTGTDTIGRRSAAELNRPHPEPASRCPSSDSVVDCTDLPDDLLLAGEALLTDGGLGLLTPLAGSGGRFGGYHVAEGRRDRLKPLLPLFTLDGRSISSMDVRAAHARFLERLSGKRVPMMLSCSHKTEPSAREWSAHHSDLDVEVAMVPEMYRISLDHWETNADAPEVSGADYILRDPDGAPLLKPSGSLGLLISAAHSGVLRRWHRDGVRVAVAANADDVGFRVDARVLGMFVASPDLDAVVLTTPAIVDDAAHRGQDRGGLLRERPTVDGWSAYVEEHAKPAADAPGEQFSTNQIYLRVESLCRLFEETTPEALDTLRRRLPLYFEAKEVRVGERQVRALHAYQPYADTLRLLSAVAAVSMTRTPRSGQSRGYAPLKSPADVETAQAILDAIGDYDNRLAFSAPQQ